MAGLYCSLEKKLYCRGSVALQYTVVYCDGSGAKVRLYRDTARRACSRALRHSTTGHVGGRGGELAGRAGGRAGHAGGALGARQGSAGPTARARGARGTGSGRAAWACYWVVGCELGALSLFLIPFDSVLFLSQFLDIVREPGS